MKSTPFQGMIDQSMLTNKLLGTMNTNMANFISEMRNISSAPIREINQEIEKTPQKIGMAEQDVLNLAEKLKEAEKQCRAMGDTTQANKLKEMLKMINAETTDVKGSMNELRQYIEETFGTDALKQFDKELKNIDKTTQKVGKKSNFGSSLKTALGIGTVALGIRKAVGFFKEANTEAVDYAETVNLFNVAMGKQTDQYGNLDKEASKYYTKAIAFQEKLSNKLGINIEESMNYQALFNSMSKSMGIADEYAYKLSENFTKLGYDLSSLFNINTENAMQKLRAGLSGQTKPLRDLGLDITQQSLEPLLDELGIERSVKQLSQAEKMVARYIVVLRQASMAHGDFANTMKSPANQLRIFNAQLTAFKRNMGSLWQGLLGNILPYVNAIMMVINELLKMVAKLFGFEVWEQDVSISTSIGADDLADDLGTATQKAKEFKKQLMGFDEINNITLPDKTSGGSGGGASVGGIDQRLLDAMEEYDNLMDKVKSKANDIRDKMMEWLGFERKGDGWQLKEGLTNAEKILDVMKMIGFAIGTWKASKAITNLMKNLGIINKSQAFKLKFGVTLAITGIFAMYKGMKHILDGNVDLFSLLETVLGAGAGTWGIVNILKATKKGKAMSLKNQIKLSSGIVMVLAGLYAQYQGTKKAFSGNADFSDIMTSLLGTAGTGIGIAQILKSTKLGKTLSYGKALTIGLSVSFAIQGLEGLHTVMQQINSEVGETQENIGKLAISSAETVGSFAMIGQMLGGKKGAILGISVGTIASLVTVLRSSNGELEKLQTNYYEIKKTHDDRVKAINETKEADLLALEVSKKYTEQLGDLIDENGRVIDGNQARVDFILGELNSALGTELQRNGDVITKNGKVVKSYESIKSSIDEEIKSLEKEIKMNAYKQLATEAMENLAKSEKAISEFEEKVKNGSIKLTDGLVSIGQESALKTYNNMLQDQEKAKEQLGYYYNKIEEISSEGMDDISNQIIETTSSTSNEVVNTVDETANKVDNMSPKYKTAFSNIGQGIKEFVNQTKALSASTDTELNKTISTAEQKKPFMESVFNKLGISALNSFDNPLKNSGISATNFLQGFINKINNLKNRVLSSISGLATSVMKVFNKGLGNASPSKKTKQSATYFMQGFEKQINRLKSGSLTQIGNLAGSMTDEFDKNLGIASIGNGITINPNDFKIDTNQFIDYGQISGAIATQSNVEVDSNIEGRIENAIYRGLSNATIPVEIEATTDEGVIFKKVQVKAKEFTMQTGEPAFNF